ncbi:PREDICTED: negative regulator of reactive oxygen species [Nanorana parkeri]|uniref:negative regulator of reactive oxygen species n=1 Tax=Nanorana parkeri TaxID=125878 RepID=UPI000854EE9A|nr:PREDICTED: negative regulator of reactive oxygen species [Nanorana parkeri]
MAIVSLWYSLGCMYLMLLQWRYSADGEKLFSQSGCQLVSGMADCRHLQLLSVPQDLPSYIQEILLDFNHIEHLGKNTFQRYKGLTNLSMKSNSLALLEKDIFQDTVKLESLSLQNNTISSDYTQVATGLLSASSLKWLDLSRNNLNGGKVTTLLKNLTSLEYLYLDYNVIMRLDDSIFEGLNSLRELSLQGNYIYEIEKGTFDHLTKLNTLNLAFNLLPCIVDFSLIQLKFLNLSFNHIEWFLAREVDVDFQLEKLDISHNQLFYFPLLPMRHHLHTLLLSDNNMKFYAHLFDANSSFVDFLILDQNISSIITVNLWEGSISSNLSSLQIMDMSRNNFDYLPEDFLPHMTSLSELRLSWNCLDTFDLSSGHISNVLINLDLSNNDLWELKIDTSSQSFPQLLYLNLSKNRLQDLPQKIFHTMIRLDTLDLSHNLIQLCSDLGYATADQACVDLKNTGSIRQLQLAASGLNLDTHNVFQGMELTHLDISYNPLKGLYFLKDTARTIKFLSIRNSSSFLDTIDFSDFVSLVSLDLSENSLKTFPGSLIHLPLQYLDIRKNRLISIPLSGSNQPLTRNLNTVFLSKNPFDCCKLSWFEILKASRSISIPDLQEMTCNFSNTYMSVPQLPESVLYSCKWKSGGTLLAVLLTVPVSVTLLVALLLLFLTFKQPILKMFKRRFRMSSQY